MAAATKQDPKFRRCKVKCAEYIIFFFKASAWQQQIWGKQNQIKR